MSQTSEKATVLVVTATPTVAYLVRSRLAAVETSCQQCHDIIEAEQHLAWCTSVQQSVAAVVLIDPDTSINLDALITIQPDLRIIVLLQHNDLLKVWHCLRHPIHSILHEPISAEELQQAVFK